MNSKTQKISRLGTLVPVIVRSSDGKTKPGKIYIRTWNEKQRLERSLKILGVGWGMAVISIFIPLAHFILVPGFLIGAPIAAFRAHRQKSGVLGGESICPNCGEVLPLVYGANIWPLQDLCSHCQTSVTIEKASTD